MRYFTSRLTGVASFKVPLGGDYVKGGGNNQMHPEEKEHIPHNACYNVFSLEDNSLCAPMCNYFGELYETLLKLPVLTIAGRGMVRLVKDGAQNNLSSGSGFFLLPNIVASNEHVISTLNKAILYNNLWGYETINNALDNRDDVYQFNSKDSQFRPWLKEFPISYHWRGEDPILGAQGDFNNFDLASIKVTCKGSRKQKIFMVPSPRVLQVGDEILTLSFPGDLEGKKDLFSDYCEYEQWAADSDFLMKNVFNGCGKLCVSAGNVLAPYQCDSNECWVPFKEYKFTKDNHDVIVSDECLIFGCSGAAVISPSCRMIQVEDYTFVEFHSIHTGGEFISCQECLKSHKQMGINSGWSNWDFCEECKRDGSSLKRGLGYNCSLSVHSRPFVEFYSKTILPGLLELVGGELDKIDFLKEYCMMHDILPSELQHP